MNHHTLADPWIDLDAAGNIGHAFSQRRLLILATVDNANFSWVHFRVGLVAGMGFFTDAYDLFAINIASVIIASVYGHPQSPPPTAGQPPWNVLTPSQDTGLKVASSVGNLIGQLIFGWYADIVGRKRMYGVELLIMIVATFAQALAGQGLALAGKEPAVTIVSALIVWRFLMGIGVGGDYPLSAVITSEFAPTRSRGRLMTAVFSLQGWGQLAASIVSAVVITAYRGKLQKNDVDPTHPYDADPLWRLIIGLGCVPAAIALYFRLTIPETPRFTLDIDRNVRQAARDVDTFLTVGNFAIDPDAVVHRVAAPKATISGFVAYFSRWDDAKLLVGTACSWFAIDVAFYGLGLNSSSSNLLKNSPIDRPPEDLYNYLFDISANNVILSAAGLLPGYYATLLLIDVVGRKPIQLMGFSVLAIIFFIMGAKFDELSKTSALFALYCVANFFQNFGPNTTTFIIPGEAFPTRYRSTAHGISAAIGKLGAICGQIIFAEVTTNGMDSESFPKLFYIFAVFMIAGGLLTLLVPETKGRSLEDISGEAQENFIRGLV